MRKFLFCILGAIIFACAFAGCGGCKKNPPNPLENDALSFDKTELSLVLGESYVLNVTFDAKDGETLTFSSENADVASVNEDGVVVAESIGETVVTAKYADNTASCKVVVGLNGLVPVLKFEQTTADALTVRKNDELNFVNYISFNGKKYTDAVVRYYLSDETIGTFENGVFKPSKIGTVTVDVEASWRGAPDTQLKKSFTVKIINDVELFVNDGSESEFTVYTCANFGGNAYETFKTFVPTAKVNGESATASVTVKSGSEFVTFENNKITAKTHGVAQLEIFCTVDGETYKETVTVNSERPVIKTDKVIDYDTTVAFNAQNVFGEDCTLAEAVDSTGETLTVDGNVIKGFSITREKPKARAVIVYNDEGGYEVTLTPYSKIIKTAEDLKFFDYKGTTTVWDGYYILANDIDASEYTHKHSVKNTSADVWAAYEFGLLGTFDGNGHVIDGITVGHGGLFMMIATSATVKDVALTNVRFAAENRTGTLAAYISDYNSKGTNVTLSNLYVQTKSMPSGSESGILAYSINTGCVKFKNIVIETWATSKQNGSFVYREARPDFVAANVGENVYVVSPTPLSYYANVTGGPAYKVMDAGNTENVNSVYKLFKRYDDYPAMKAAGNTYTGFDSAIWDTEKYGVPCFKDVTIDVNRISVKESYMLDATDGVLYSEETGNVVTIDGIFRSENVVLTSVSDELTSDLTVNDNKINGYTVSGTPVTRSITLFAGDKNTVITVTPYTRVIDSAEDLAIFNYSASGKSFDGYYVLAKNIDASGYTHTHEKEITSAAWSDSLDGLSGTFDGRGYTINGITFGNYGLFGIISNKGTVKNLGLTDVKYGSADNVSALAYVVCDNNSAVPNATIENLYLQANALPTGENSGALFVRCTYMASVKNVIVNIVESCTSGASFIGKLEFAATTSQRDAWNNIYVISKCKLGKDNTNNEVDAGNIDTEMVTNNGYYKNVKRYETAAQMKAANNSYTTFSSAYWTVTTGEIPVWKTATANTSNT